MTMQKIAAAELDGLLVKSASVIRSQAARITELETKLAEKDRYEYAEKIASIAVDRGIMSEESASDYARQLASSDKDLSMVEEFVSHNNGAGLSLGEEHIEKKASAGMEHMHSNADRDFADFLLTSEFSA